MYRRLSKIIGELAFATGATALALPLAAANIAVVSDKWVNGQGNIIPAFDLAIWSDLSTNLTAAELFAAEQHPKVVSATPITSLDHTTGIITLAGHGLVTGDGALTWSSTGAVPTGLDPTNAGTYAIVIDANTFKVASSIENALRGTAVAFSDNGSGVISFTGAAAQRVYWHSMALLGNANDGAVALTANRGYVRRCTHAVRAIAYGVIATFSAANAISISIAPVVDA